MDLTPLLDVLSDTGTVISLLAVILGFAGSLFASLLSFRGKISPLPDENANLEDLTRVDEVQDALKHQESVTRWAGRANGLLLFGQIVIGGVLASAFVQDHIDKRIIGLLGLLVLVSSLVHQQFRPDLKQSGARRRVARLRQLLREVEDSIFEIQRKSPSAEPVEVIRKRVTQQLSRIEQSEVEELPGEQRLPGRIPVVVPEPTPSPTALDTSGAQPGAAADALEAARR